MSNIGETLKRKFGPLPVWGWTIVAFIAVYWYRNKSGLSAKVQTVSTGGSITPVSPAPQPITTLGPGESAYDPNTGQLVSSPGGSDGSGGMADPSNAIDNLAQAIADAIAAGTSGGKSGATTTASGKSVHTGKPGKNTGKRTAKTKQGAKKNHGGTVRKRGAAAIGSSGHKNTGSVHSKPGRVRNTLGKLGASKNTRTSSRVKTGATQQVTNQRPRASNTPRPTEVHPSPQRQAPTRTAPRPTPARHPSVTAPKPVSAPKPAPPKPKAGRKR